MIFLAIGFIVRVVVAGPVRSLNIVVGSGLGSIRLTLGRLSFFGMVSFAILFLTIMFLAIFFPAIFSPAIVAFGMIFLAIDFNAIDFNAIDFNVGVAGLRGLLHILGSIYRLLRYR